VRYTTIGQYHSWAITMSFRTAIRRVVEIAGSFGENKKDSYSNLCGVATAIALSGLYLIERGLLPAELTNLLAGVIGVSQIWLSYLTGKSPQATNNRE